MSTSQPSSAPSIPIPYAWATVALLWPVALLNYLDRNMIATIRASIRADIPSIANDQDFGMIMALFLWVYALLSPVGGFIADRFNRRWTVIGSLFVWSAITWLTGHARTYDEMKWCRALMGVSEAFYMPAALSLIAEFHPGNTRASAVGIHMSGIYAGLALGGIGGYIAAQSSWRNCFTWFGAAGILYAVVLMVLLRNSPKRKMEEGSAPVSVGGTLFALGSSGAFWILVVYFTLPAIAGWAMKNWGPTYLADTFHLKEGPAGIMATGYIQAASFVGVLLGGFLADRWMRFSSHGRIWTSALGIFLCAPALWGLGYAGGLDVAIGAMILFGLGWGFFDCNNMPILCQIVRPEHRATGYGIMNMVSIGTGAMATVLLGWMRDKGISFSHAFAVCAVINIASVALILTIKIKNQSSPSNADLAH